MTTSSPSLRSIIFRTTRPREVSAKMEALEAAYKRTHKRALPVDLFMATWGQLPHAEYGVNVHYSPEQAPIVEFLRQTAQAA